MADPKNSFARDAKADAAMRALVELFENLKGKSPLYRTYSIEHIDGELALRQTEASAAIASAIAAANGDASQLFRHVIKLKKQ